jgi:dipeptide/tripeptide permease
MLHTQEQENCKFLFCLKLSQQLREHSLWQVVVTIVSDSFQMFNSMLILLAIIVCHQFYIKVNCQ